MTTRLTVEELVVIEHVLELYRHDLVRMQDEPGVHDAVAELEKIGIKLAAMRGELEAQPASQPPPDKARLEEQLEVVNRALRAALDLLDCVMYRRAIALAIAHGFVASDKEEREIKEAWDVIGAVFKPEVKP